MGIPPVRTQEPRPVQQPQEHESVNPNNPGGGQIPRAIPTLLLSSSRGWEGVVVGFEPNRSDIRDVAHQVFGEQRGGHVRLPTPMPNPDGQRGSHLRSTPIPTPMPVPNHGGPSTPIPVRTWSSSTPNSGMGRPEREEVGE